MTKLIGILIVHGNKIDPDITDIHINYIIEKVSLLNYHVSKVSAITFDKTLIISELSNLLKQNDFVVFINAFQSSIYKYFDEIFNFTNNNSFSVSQQYFKLLTYNNYVKVEPIAYLNRIFIIQDLNIKLVVDNVLLDHLKQFNKERVFIKNLKLDSPNIINSLGERDSCVEVKYLNDGSTHIIQLISPDLKRLVEYQKYIQKQFSKCCPSEYYLDSAYNKNSFNHVQQAIDCIEKCISQFGLKNVFVSFNGGKDCTVLLHLVLGVLREKYPEHTDPLVCMYVQSPNPFPEVNDFIGLLQHYYNLEIVTMTNNVRDSLEQFLQERSNMKACFMGTRRTDPYSGNLETFQTTDPNWPQVMRVSPLLDWHYSEIWDYLLYYQVPYCNLYDEGYTSLGNVNNTRKNPNLLHKLDEDTEVYLPAYKLLCGTSERSGRT